MAGFLESLEVTSTEERVYRQVLRTAPVSAADVATALGWPRESVADPLAHLAELGLLSEATPGVFEAADPRLTIGRLVEDGLDQVQRRRHELERTRDAIARFAMDHERERPRRRAPTWEVVPSDLVRGVVRECLATTSGTIRSSVISADWSPDGIEQSLVEFEHATVSGRTMRAIYPLEAMDTASGREWVARFAALGEEQRVVDTPLTEFVCFGHDLVLATIGWQILDGDCVKVRDPMLVRTFIELFDRTWRTGTRPADEASDEGDAARLVTLLAAGHKDQTIARHLGVSLRTVRRRVSTLMDEHGVDTRFQLGLVLGRTSQASTR